MPDLAFSEARDEDAAQFIDWARDVGVPEVSTRDSVNAARDSQIEIRAKQRIGV